MRAFRAQISNGVRDRIHAVLPGGVRATAKNTTAAGAERLPELNRHGWVVAGVGEERNREMVCLKFALPEIADIAAKPRQNSVGDAPFFQALAVMQDVVRQFMGNDRRNQISWIVFEKAAADLHHVAIGICCEIRSDDKFETRLAGRNGIDRADVILAVALAESFDGVGWGEGRDLV